MNWVYGIVAMLASWLLGHIIGCSIGRHITYRRFGEERLEQVKKEIPLWKPWKAWPWHWKIGEEE